MLRYRYHLEGVLRVRRIQEDAARGALVRALAAQSSAEAALRTELARYRALAEEAATAEDLRGRAQAKLAAQAVTEAEQRLVAAGQAVDAARAGWENSAREVEVLERLDQRRREEHALEAQRAEAAETDDLVLSRRGRDEVPA